MNGMSLDNLAIRETTVDATEGCIISEIDTPLREAYLWWEGNLPTAGELYREGLRTLGRCAGKVYVDGVDGQPRHVGYVFHKRDHYEDTGAPYLRETWVSIVAIQPAPRAVHQSLS